MNQEKDKKQYWPDELTHIANFGAFFEMRTELAWQLIRQYGLVSGTPDGEDSGGRSKHTNMTVRETVDRCFDLADEFVDAAEDRGGIRVPILTEEQKAARRAGLVKLERELTWKKIEEDAISGQSPTAKTT
jgi:hypothetical protein